MRRREFMLPSARGTPRARGAAGRIASIAWGPFHPVAPITENSPFGKIIVKVLAQHGYVLGRNLMFDAQFDGR